MRAAIVSTLVLVLACGGDDGGSGGEETSTTSGTTAADGSESMSSTTAPMTTSTTGGPDCAAPADCTECWLCARNGSCRAEFDACASNFECAGSLFCIDSMCTPDGITTDCTELCCMNCTEHFTCGVVDTWLSCMSAQCSDLCQPNDCSP